MNQLRSTRGGVIKALFGIFLSGLFFKLKMHVSNSLHFMYSHGGGGGGGYVITMVAELISVKSTHIFTEQTIRRVR